MSVILIGLALLGLWVAVLAVRELLRRSDIGPWPHKLFALVAVVLGIADQSELVPSSSAVQLAMVAGTVIAVLFVLSGPADWRSSPQAARCCAVGLVFVLWLDLFITNTMQNTTLDLSSVVERLAPGIFWIAALLLWMAGGIRRDLLALVLALGVALVAVVTPLSPRAVRACDEFKCNVLGELVRGPFSSENYLAMLAAFAVVLVLSCEVGRVRWPTVMLCVGLLLATGGRSSMVGAFIGLAVIGFVLVTFRGRRRTGPAVVLAISLPVVCAGVGLSIVYLASTEDLSNRGAIWVKARDALAGQELFGLGISRWSGYGQYRAISSHFPHSVYLLILFCGGLVAVTLLVAAVAAGILGAAGNHRDLAAAAGYAATYLTIGISEIVTNPMTVDGLTWAVMPLLAAGGAARRASEPDHAPLRTVAVGSRG